MNYLFTWNSDFLVKQKVMEWKNQFIKNNWDFNLIHIKNFETVENNFLTLNITSWTFLNEKKLVIIDLETKAEDKKIEKKLNNENIESKDAEKEDLLLNLLSKTPENNYIIINVVKPDKRTKFYKWLLKLCEIKEYNTSDNNNLSWIITKMYPKVISNTAIDILIKYKSWNLNKIASEIEKLLITFSYIDKKEIIENIIPELEESIFQVIDDILNKQIVDAVKKIDIILNDTNIYAFYNNLLANLRTTVYISKLLNLWIKTGDIGQLLDLWNRTFLINKKYRISYNELKKIYINLLNIDKIMKTWKLIWTEELDFQYEIERQLLKIG